MKDEMISTPLIYNKEKRFLCFCLNQDFASKIS